MNSTRIIFVALMTLGLTACGSVGISSVPGIGNLFGGGEEKAAAQNGWTPEPQYTPASRAIQVAWTAMRAKKCGYNFDEQKLRASFLQAEAAIVPDPGAIAKLQRAYDYTAKKIGAQIGPEKEYCTRGRVRQIKSDLKRHLAGDFNPTPRKHKKAVVSYKKEIERPPMTATEVFGRHWDD